MKISEHSRKKFYNTFDMWRVAPDFADPMYNYLIHAWNPGSFFTAVLANDFRRAVQCSHPANTVNAMKGLVGWVGDNMPVIAHGSHEAVRAWEMMPVVERRAILEAKGLIYTEKEETWLHLKEPA